jgi:hypothetical protein
MLKEHPTDLEVGESGWNSRAAYLRAYRRQQSELSAKSNLESKSAEFQASGGTERSSGRLPQHLDNPYPGSYTQRAFRPTQSEAQVAPATQIPALTPQAEKEAKDNYQMFWYPYTTSLDAKRYGMRFAAAIGIVHPQEVWDTLDPVRQNIIKASLNSTEAKARFA